MRWLRGFFRVEPKGFALCDDNPMANNGVKISLQASTSCLKGRTSDMVEIGSCRDDSAHDIRLPFSFRFLDTIYNGSVFVSSNSYVTFGGSSTARSGLGPRVPPLPTLFIGGRDNALRNVSAGPDAEGWRVRYEGWSLPSLVTTHQCSLQHPPTIVWELIFLFNGTLQLCTDFLMEHVTGVSAVSDGFSNSFVQKFTLTPSTLYRPTPFPHLFNVTLRIRFIISTGLNLCECDDDPQFNNGIKMTSQPSNSCLKGRSPDMIDVRSCQRAGSASILLPFPFSFLGRTYGGQSNDVFVGDSSFVTFGGADNNFYSSFEPDSSDLPALLIGARQNVLKSLSVARDALGWRVRYEGWSNHGASLDPYPTLKQAFSCNIPSSVAANITWELLFLHDSTLRLCTGSLMGNVDPIFDSFAITERICSANNFCTNFFQNLSAVSALSDGKSRSFLRTFNLTSATLYTISTKIQPCSMSCDENPQLNKGVKVTAQSCSTCLKGQAPEMTVVGRCQDSQAFDIRLPFPVHFLGRSYSGGDVFVGSNSYVTFGSPDTTSALPSAPALLIGARGDNGLRKLSVGADALGWRVRFEGWDTFLSPYRSIDCNRPADIIWELLFMFNSTMQLYTSSLMNNLDVAQKPRAVSSVWDGSLIVANISLEHSSAYTISTGLPPCFLELSLSSPIAAVNGSSLTVRFPSNLRLSRFDSVKLVITLQGAGFSCAPNSPVSLLVSPARSQANGVASMSDDTDSSTLLVITLRGISNCSILSLTLLSVTTPVLPQDYCNDISFSVFDSSQNVVFASDSGSLVKISPRLSIDDGQPVVQLINNAIKSSSTMNITLTPNFLEIPAAFVPSVLVITLVGAGWSVGGAAQGLLVKSVGGKFESVIITEESPTAPVLRVTFSGAFSIKSGLSLQLLVFNVTTVSIPQPAASSIRSAILNSAGSIIASGTGGKLDAVVASTMGDGSPRVTVFPPLASASGAVLHVALTPRPQYQQYVTLPASIIITLSGFGSACGPNAIVTFTSPFDAVNGTASLTTVAGKSILTVGVTSGTFLSGYPVLFSFGPCASSSHTQPQAANVSAAVIDKNGRTVAASASGTLGEIVQDMGQTALLLTDNSLNVTLMPRVTMPANSFLVISLIGVGLVCKEATSLQFSRPAIGAMGTASINGRALESVINISFSTQHFAGTAIALTVSPVHGGCSSDVSNAAGALLDESGKILAATASATFSAVMTRPMVTVQHFISAAVNGSIFVPEGTYSGKCNCNNRVDENVPNRKLGAAVEMKGKAGRSIIDCSGTGMRCLIVKNASISVVDIIFKGGSSPVFMSASAIAAILAIFDSENQTLTAPSYQRPQSSAYARKILHDDRHAQADSSAARSIEKLGTHNLPTFGSKRGRLDALLNKAAPAFEKIETTRVFNARQILRPSRAVPIVHQRKIGRRLFQSVPSALKLLPFKADADESGGCIFVLAPTHSVSLSGVSLIRCSAVYGGGGFFNVSKFNANKSTADGNVARQGGGIFVAAYQTAEIEMCEFLNNTAASSSASERPSASSPDPAWAAGAGAWLLLLTTMNRCIFEQNTALAAKTVDGSGPHVLGSGIYIFQTSRGSNLADLVFFRSKSLCAGVGCYSAGSVFIAIAGFNTSIHGLTCNECHVAAMSTMFFMFTSTQTQAIGACVSVIDATAGLLEMKRFESNNCSAQSSGSIFGGCLHFSRLDNAVISHVAVFGFNYKSALVFRLTQPFSQCGSGGIALFSDLKNTIIMQVSVTFVKLHCMGDIYGAVIRADQVSNSNISLMRVSNVAHSNVIGANVGGVLYIQAAGTVFATNISIQNSSFLGRRFNGAWIFAISSWDQIATGTLVLRGLFVRNVTSHAAGQAPYDAYTPLYTSPTSFISLNIYPMGLEPMSVIFEDSVFQDVSVTCSGNDCTNYGLIYIRTELVDSPYRTVNDYSQSLYFSNASFENVQSRCQGFRCHSRSACLALSVRDAMIIDIRLKNVTVSSDGLNSFAGGSFLFHFHNNPLKSMLISNVTSHDARVFATGTFSTAIGGVIAAVYGNLVITNVRFLGAQIVCTGRSCQSLGGSVAFVSSLGPSNKRIGVCSATIAHSTLGDAVVECRGESCEATGGAIFVAISYRGPIEQLGTQTPIASMGIRPMPLTVHIINCSIVRNTIKSESLGASLAGAGVAFLAEGSVTDSRIRENIINSTLLSAFSGGAGIYVAGINSSAAVTSSIIELNDAGVSGSGGAIFAGFWSIFYCENSALESNRAAKGGGLFVDDNRYASIVNTSVRNNEAREKGGGIFCVAVWVLNTSAGLEMINVTVLDNFLQDKHPEAIGAAVYIFGDVTLRVHAGTRFLMNSNNDYTTTEAIISISGSANINDDTAITCKSGSVLSIARIQVVKQNVAFNEPSPEEQFETQCGPACLFQPQTNDYNASSGFLASCVPCPRGTYSILSSSDSTETVSSQCLPCPFGALCHGGSNISAAKSFWGWKVSDSRLSSRFVLLPSGYGCVDDCVSVLNCGGHRDGILCGACAPNYSIAFFSNECVSSKQCDSRKWILLIAICVVYQFLFSVCIYWSTESALLQKQQEQKSINKQALSDISLFQKLSPVQIDKILSKMELVQVPALTTIMTQGQQAQFMFIIKTGALNVYTFDVANGENSNSRLVAPSIVGELSLISVSKCLETVQALEDCELWKLDVSCLEDVAEEDKASYLEQKQAEHSKSDTAKRIKAFTVEDIQGDAFGILMWFYQLSGIMFSVASPFSYINGAAVAYSVLSFFVNSKPSSDAAADLTSKSRGSSEVSAADADRFQFCLSSDFTMSQVYVATFMYYLLWALMMALLTNQSVWLSVRNRIISCSLSLADVVERCRWSNQVNPGPASISVKQRLLERQTTVLAIQGSVFLKWFITCFSALSTLLMQGTACVRLSGLQDSSGENRWIYDGRIVCFSNFGDYSGEWQIASAAGVAVALIAPAGLWRVMVRLLAMEKHQRSRFQESVLQTYLGAYASNARHWMVIMFYQRLVLMIVSIYLDPAPFFQGYAMLCVCILILAMECTYRPYKSFFMQVLSCTSAVALVAICGLLLRSQALISAARSPNFEKGDPSKESDGISSDLFPIICMLILLLATPAVLSVLLAVLANSRVANTATDGSKITRDSSNGHMSGQLPCSSIDTILSTSNSEIVLVRVVADVEQEITSSRTSRFFAQPDGIHTDLRVTESQLRIPNFVDRSTTPQERQHHLHLANGMAASGGQSSRASRFIPEPDESDSDLRAADKHQMRMSAGPNATFR